MIEFLDDIDPRRWRELPAGSPPYLHPVEFYLGSDPERGRDITVRVADADRAPARGDLERVWQSLSQALVLVLVARYDYKGSPVVDLVGGRRSLPDGAAKGSRPRPLVVQRVPLAEARNFCRAILEEESPFAANRLVARWLDERATDLPGLKNDGLLARHALLTYVPERADWADSTRKAGAARDRSGRDLVRSLGFTIDDATDPNASLLTFEGSPHAAALFLEGAVSFDEPSAQYGAISPVTHALTVAKRHRVRWVVLTRGRSIRLHPVSPDIGVGRRGRSTTYVEINLQMLPEDRLGYLWSLFSVEALSDGGLLDEILAASERFANELGGRLRERVYHEVVPALATALGRRSAAESTDGWLDEAYHRTMVVLFRLLFVAYAEDKGLLPYDRNVPYTNASLKSIAQELVPYLQGEQEFSDGSAVFWRRVVNLWRAVDRGKRDWGIPPYDGGLFTSSSPAGAALDAMELPDHEFGPPLARLLVDVDPDGVIGPVDFRSLSVREFGTIYEGLLESELSVAEVDLTVDEKGLYVPADDDDDVVVEQGDVYFHNRSGARKATGSYFTKPFAVEHLLDHALETAVDEHFERVRADLDRGDDAAAARRFFDFRCVDLAMGSGHFLVAAVDRLEARFSEFLDDHPIPGVTRELETLRQAALEELRHCADDALIENSALLRRQIARRCIYGVDLNPVSVELARLAIWIHTFVPGLPLSFLDHNLVVGNSLTGIGTLDEARDALAGQLGAADLRAMIDVATPALERLATVSDATVADVKAAKQAHEEALAATEEARRLFDVLVLARASIAGVEVLASDPESVERLHRRSEVRSAIDETQPLHFPIAYPEVFLRDRPGFDCILGNPPWEKLHVEEHQWWGLRSPGIRSLPVSKMNAEIARLRRSRPDLQQAYETDVAAAGKARSVLMSGPYPELGSSHPDLYKAFSWRFWQLVASGGGIGVVLPRAALSSSGMAAWRNELLDHGDFVEVTQLVNNRKWVFDEVHPQYTIALVSLRKTGHPDEVVSVRGPFASLTAYRAGKEEPTLDLPASGLKEWTNGAAFPLIPGRRAGEVFLKIRAHPRLDDPRHPFRFRPVQGDLNSTAGKRHMVMDPNESEGLWPVFGGASINLWSGDTGERYAWADPETVVPVLEAKVRASLLRQHSAFTALVSDDGTIPSSNYPWNRARLAWRRISRATDSRTVIPALVAPHVVLQDTAPFFVTPPVSEAHEAFVLGVLSSISLDWYARRVVELHVNFHVIEAFPIPTFDPSDIRCRRVVHLAGQLASPDARFERWASALGVQVGVSQTDLDRDAMICELDAIIAHLFGLDRDDVRTVFETFHAGWDYEPRLEAVLEHYEAWAS